MGYRNRLKLLHFVLLIFSTFLVSIISPSASSNVNCCKFEEFCPVDPKISRLEAFECCSESTDWCYYRRWEYWIDYDYYSVTNCPTLYTDCFPPNQQCIYQNQQGYGVTRKAYYYLRWACYDGDDPDQDAVCGRETMWSKITLVPNAACSSTLCGNDLCD